MRLEGVPEDQMKKEIQKIIQIYLMDNLMAGWVDVVNEADRRNLNVGVFTTSVPAMKLWLLRNSNMMGSGLSTVRVTDPNTFGGN